VAHYAAVRSAMASAALALLADLCCPVRLAVAAARVRSAGVSHIALSLLLLCPRHPATPSFLPRVSAQGVCLADMLAADVSAASCAVAHGGALVRLQSSPGSAHRRRDARFSFEERHLLVRRTRRWQ
jgi:hypothetical protein